MSLRRKKVALLRRLQERRLQQRWKGLECPDFHPRGEELLKELEFLYHQLLEDRVSSCRGRSVGTALYCPATI